MKKLLTVFYLLFLSISFAQIYTPIDTANQVKRKALAENYENKYKVWNDYLKKLNLPYSNEVLKVYKNIEKDFIGEIKNGQFLFYSPIQSFADSILLKLQNANPQIPKDIQLLISKNGSLNAYSLGENTVVINLGTFDYLENEQQIAAVLSHEISHQILKHSLQSITNRIDNEKSSKGKDNIQKIKENKFNRGERAFEMLKNQLYDLGKINRTAELEADETGFNLYKNAGFLPSQYLSSLQLIEKYDTVKPVGVTLDVYKKYFDLPDHPFQEKWTKMEDFSAYDYSKFIEKINEDSISTHPKTSERITALINKHKDTNWQLEANYKPSPEYLKISNIANLEKVPNLYFSEDYGYGVYVCLFYLQNEKEVEYYEKWLGLLFEKIYEARKKYQLNRYLERLAPKDQSESYQYFLNFMWNLSLDDIKAIADFYQKK